MIELEDFLKNIDLRKRVRVLMEADIRYLSAKTTETIMGFGFYTGWLVDMSPSNEFWIPCLLHDGFEFDEDEVYATGSWDGFDQAYDVKMNKEKENLYTELWNFAEQSELSDTEIYEEVRLVCAEELLACESLIEEMFEISEEMFILSFAEHDEEGEAKERMQIAKEGDKISPELRTFCEEIIKNDKVWVNVYEDNIYRLNPSDKSYDNTLELFSSKSLAEESCFNGLKLKSLTLNEVLDCCSFEGYYFKKEELSSSFPWLGLNGTDYEISKKRFIKGLKELMKGF